MNRLHRVLDVHRLSAETNGISNAAVDVIYQLPFEVKISKGKLIEEVTAVVNNIRIELKLIKDCCTANDYDTENMDERIVALFTTINALRDTLLELIDNVPEYQQAGEED